MLHYAQSAMVVESLNKQVSLSSTVIVHVGKDFISLGYIVCRVALIFDYHKTLQYVTLLEWWRRSQDNFVCTSSSCSILC